MSNNQEKSDDPFGTSNDYETSPAGDLGKEYQRKVLALQLCLAHQKFSNFKIATEVQIAGVFDDLVLEVQNGCETKIYFVQIKNKKKKDLTAHMLMKDEDFDLHKYFLAFVEINFEKEFGKFKNKIFSIYTNMKLSLRDEDFLEFDELKIYVEKFEKDESLITHRSGESFKIIAESENEKFLEYFKEKVLCIKSIEDLEEKQKIIEVELKKSSSGKLKRELETCKKLIKNLKAKQERLENFNFNENELKEKIKNFFENLILSTAQPEFHEIDNELDDLCLKLFKDSSLKPELEDFFRPVDLNAQKVTKKIFDDFLFKKEIGREFERLVGVTKEFLDSTNLIKFEKEFVDKFQRDDKVSILRTPKDLRNLGLKVIIQNYELEDIENGKIIFTKFSTFKSQMKKILSCVKLKKTETLLIEIDEENFNFVDKTLDVKIIFVSDFDIQFDEIPVKFLSDDENLIANFDESFQKELFENFEVNFQNEIVKFSEIFESIETFISSVDDETLAKILNRKLSIGGEIKSSNFNEDFYVERNYGHGVGNFDFLTFKIDDLMQRLSSNAFLKKILIYDVAGMGKSTEITKIGLKIKENHKNFWVLKIELGSEKFMKAFNSWDKKFLFDILDSFIESSFEKKIFRELYNYEKVAVLLDGFDEIPTETFPEALQSLFEKILNSFLCEDQYKDLKNFFVITSRTNLIDDCYYEKSKKLKAEDFKNFVFRNSYLSKISVFRLKAFDTQQQIKFVYDWILKNFKENQNENFGAQLFDFSTKLISTWSQTLNDENFLGVPLQVRMLAEVFGHRIKDEGKFPEIPDKISLTNLFRIFFDNKYSILYSKEQISKDIFVKLCKGEIKVEETILKFSLLLLNTDWFDRRKENFEPSEDDRKLMVNVGLMNFHNDRAIFIHRAFPEFLAAEKFFEILNEKDENKIQELVKAHRSVFEAVLLHSHQMCLTFVEEFLNEKPKFGVKILQEFCKISNHQLLGILQQTFTQGACQFFMLAFEFALKDLRDIVNIFTVISCEKVSKKIMKNFPQILRKIFQNYREIKHKKVDENLTLIDVVSAIISRIFNESTFEENQEALELVRNWKILKQPENRKKLIKSRLKSFQVEQKGEENFLKFFKNFDDNLIKTLIEYHQDLNPYVFYVDLLGLEIPGNFLESWATEKNLNYKQEVKSQLNIHKNKILQFYIQCFGNWDIEKLHSSKCLNPGILIEILKSEVDNFECFSFPFLYKIDGLEIARKKFEKMEELFNKNHQKEYEELFKAFMRKSLKFCKLYNECHYFHYRFDWDYYHSRSSPQNFIGGSLLGFVEIGKISIEDLSDEICRFLHDFVLRNFYLISKDEDRRKYLSQLKKKLNDDIHKKENAKHKCKNCFFCKKNNFEFCKKEKCVKVKKNVKK